jgi:acetyl esterase/lipase
MRITRFFLLLLMISRAAHSQQSIPLYQGELPFGKPCNETDHEFIDTSWNKSGILIVDHITRPSMTIYRPPKKSATRAAVIIFPGGGYGVLAAGHEGADVARAFNAAGVTAIVVRYRLPIDECMTDKTWVPLTDAQQAIFYVRTHAASLGLDEHRIGIMGFSAGGHLASTAGTHTTAVRHELAAADLRPDFMLLIYPVISFNDEIGHIGSRDNLLGKSPAPDTVRLFSNEEHVTGHTPPTFLVHASDDDTVNPENSIRFYQALLKNKVPAELHLYEHGGHGFGMHNESTTEDWFKDCIAWLTTNHFIH